MIYLISYMIMIPITLLLIVFFSPGDDGWKENPKGEFVGSIWIAAVWPALIFIIVVSKIEGPLSSIKTYISNIIDKTIIGMRNKTSKTRRRIYNKNESVKFE